MDEDGKPIGLRCPACGQEPLLVLADVQAFCETGDCPVSFWNPEQTRAEFFANASEATVATLGAEEEVSGGRD